ncbi:helix-turn-helix domain-containing protein [Parasediminibacterium paludis]|uniref:Helix-turn-helix domain-containing protein n=1 Tax=Parasediminibacterium paludis TaxID=908966 RepID=A0ABV8PUX9_9BACT
MQGNIIISVPLVDFISQIEQTVRKVLSEREIQQDKLLSSEEVMQLFSISTTTLQKWRNDGKIPFTRIDNKIFYSKTEVLEALKTRQVLPIKL